jgi:MmyB-like transcription regulator ligand binding domain/Helix-turn-helix domain
MGITATRLAEGPEPAVLTIEDDAKRRQELRAFLMSRRARLKPSDVGLPDTPRRRTPGLRREEVAQLAGLSTEWYTLFEMAKDTGVSQRTIEAVSSALRLTPAEQKHLHQLATGTLPAISPDQTVDPTLLDVLDGYHTGPAMLLNVRMDVVAANRLAVAIFGDLAAAPEFEKNWLWYLYEHHHMVGEWESQARELTATFRASQCAHANDPAYIRLMNRLLETSETFRRYWNEHDVGKLEDVPPLTLAHPVLGPLRFTMRVLAQPGATNAFYCCFLVPDAATSTAPAYSALRRSLEP